MFTHFISKASANCLFLSDIVPATTRRVEIEYLSQSTFRIASRTALYFTHWNIPLIISSSEEVDGFTSMAYLLSEVSKYTSSLSPEGNGCSVSFRITPVIPRLSFMGHRVIVTLFHSFGVDEPVPVILF